MTGATLSTRHLGGDLWGGLAAMMVALPSSIAFGVTILAPLGPQFGAQGAIAGILGVTLLGLIAALFGGTQRLISAPCAPARPDRALACPVLPFPTRSAFSCGAP